MPDILIESRAMARADISAIAKCYRDGHPHSTRSDQHLGRCGMREKAHRAGGAAVGAGHEHHDQVARLGARQLHAVGQQVERRAQRADHRLRLRRPAGSSRLPIATG